MPQPWQEFWAAFSLLDFAGWVLGTFAVIAFFVKVWPFIRKLFALVDSLGQLPEFMERTDERIEEIHHEVRYNNGSSVKDAITRVEATVNDHVLLSLDVLVANDASARRAANERQTSVERLVLTERKE